MWDIWIDFSTVWGPDVYKCLSSIPVVEAHIPVAWVLCQENRSSAKEQATSLCSISEVVLSEKGALNEESLGMGPVQQPSIHIYTYVDILYTHIYSMYVLEISILCIHINLYLLDMYTGIYIL